MSGETNRLLALAKEVPANLDPRELDVVASTGEQLTIGLLAMALIGHSFKARSYTETQVKILTDDTLAEARIVSIDEQDIGADLADGVIVAVFQGVNEDGNIAPLSRGGADTSAVTATSRPCVGPIKNNPEVFPPPGCLLLRFLLPGHGVPCPALLP